MADQGYRVLARKYRPSTFEDLIGQEALVQTLTNAFAHNRIAQAYMLTGVRGVGKTTTARIVARGLNYELEDGSVTAPTVNMPTLGKHCQAIIESRHVDVIEMDAASHTGIDDIRDIIESVQYRPASARYKVFIIDEVHMLSKAAFNGLLKTLEEPPSHVKFIFATTEIRKVPVTVLSRCQRFDLRRVPQELLVKHLQTIATKEGSDLSDDAAAALARAAQGSVRDALSLLDQAIAQANEAIDVSLVQSMLGLADQARIIDLLEAVAKGDARESLALFNGLYDVGADPLVILKDLAGLIHLITRHKVAPEATKLAGVDEATLGACERFSQGLSMAVLSRLWQMVLKGIEEVEASNMPLPAAEMVIIRLSYVSDVPTPDDLIKLLDGKGGSSIASGGPSSGGAPSSSGPRSYATSTGATLSAVAGGRPAPRVAPEPDEAPIAVTAEEAKPAFASFEALVAFVKEKRDLKLASDLEHYVVPVKLEPMRLSLKLTKSAPASLISELKNKLTQWLGQPFGIVLENGAADLDETLAEQQAAAFTSRIEEVKTNPLVQAVLKAFPKADVVDVHEPRQLAVLPDAEGEADGVEDGLSDMDRFE